MARVLRDVDEREVAPCERDEQHGRRDERRAEGGDDRVLRREGEPAAPAPRGERAADERVERRARSSEAALRGRALPMRYVFDFAGEYFDGHFVMSEPGFATNVPLRSVPSTTIWRPWPEEVGHAARVEHARPRRARAVVVLQHEAHARRRLRVADGLGRRPCRRAGRPARRAERSVLGSICGVPAPAIDVYRMKTASTAATESAMIRRAGLRFTPEIVPGRANYLRRYELEAPRRSDSAPARRGGTR